MFTQTLCLFTPLTSWYLKSRFRREIIMNNFAILQLNEFKSRECLSGWIGKNLKLFLDFTDIVSLKCTVVVISIDSSFVIWGLGCLIHNRIVKTFDGKGWSRTSALLVKVNWTYMKHYVWPCQPMDWLPFKLVPERLTRFENSNVLRLPVW